MPLMVTLADLRRDLRAETGQSLNTQQGVQSQDTYDIMLDRQQRELWSAYEWPHLRFYIDVQLNAGQSLYNYPQSMPFDQINRIHVSDGTTAWQTMSYGIKAWEIPPGGSALGFPPRQWGNKVTVTPEGVTNATGQIQVLPIPSRTGTMRLDGQAPVTRLLSSEDRCLIDSTAIVLFTAAEILATNKSESAPLKLKKAQQYLLKLLKNSGADKRADYNMAGPGRSVDHQSASQRGYVPGIDYIP